MVYNCSQPCVRPSAVHGTKALYKLDTNARRSGVRRDVQRPLTKTTEDVEDLESQSDVYVTRPCVLGSRTTSLEVAYGIFIGFVHDQTVKLLDIVPAVHKRISKELFVRSLWRFE